MKFDTESERPTKAPSAGVSSAFRLDVEAVERRLREILDAMLREIWLPIGFRTMIVHDLPALRKALLSSRGWEAEILEAFNRICAAASGYGKTVMRSETFKLLRSFEYELSSSADAA